MTHMEKVELVMVLEEKMLSAWERRKRRLERVPPHIVADALIKARKGKLLSEQEFIASHLGFLPGERIPTVEEHPEQGRREIVNRNGRLGI